MPVVFAPESVAVKLDTVLAPLKVRPFTEEVVNKAVLIIPEPLSLIAAELVR